MLAYPRGHPKPGSQQPPENHQTVRLGESRLGSLSMPLSATNANVIIQWERRDVRRAGRPIRACPGSRERSRRDAIVKMICTPIWMECVADLSHAPCSACRRREPELSLPVPRPHKRFQGSRDCLRHSLTPRQFLLTCELLSGCQ